LYIIYEVIEIIKTFKEIFMYSVTKNGKDIDKSLYAFDGIIFSSKENGLVLDFSDKNYITFDTRSNCTFKTGIKSVIVRRDIFEVITLKEGGNIKLNRYYIPGYTKINNHKIVIDGKEITLSEESYNHLKESLK